MTPAVLKEKLGMGEDKVYAVIGDFATPEELVEAGRRIRSMGYTRLDAMSPFPVHGIDDAIGVPPSKLGWIVIVFAILGALSGLGLIYYTGVISYPLVIGGKPLFDFAFSIPVTFELTILFAALATFVGIFAVNGLPQLYHPAFNYSQVHRATDDRFLLVIEADDPIFNAHLSADHLRGVGAASVEVVEG
jgi:ActD protein